MFYRTNENRNQIETTGIKIKAQNTKQTTNSKNQENRKENKISMKRRHQHLVHFQID